MARKTYTGTFNLDTLQPEIESVDPAAVLFLRAGTFAAATNIEVDARNLTPIDTVVAAHNPATRSPKQSDFDSGVAKLKVLGLTDAELTAIGILKTARTR